MFVLFSPVLGCTLETGEIVSCLIAQVKESAEMQHKKGEEGRGKKKRKYKSEQEL